jgi:poly(hydroxyalkanoate) depolymerase family esterase
MKTGWTKPGQAFLNIMPLWRLSAFLLAVSLAGPAAAQTQSWWCSWQPWLPVCTSGAPGIPPGSGGVALTEVTGFGSNPGNLKMYRYLPAGLENGRPLVVALHGCTQQASAYDDETGWIRFADRYRFALLLPEQQQANNTSKCFNWFQVGDNTRGSGEALSIRQMIDRMMIDAGSDPARVYVTGLSAGGAMTAVMLATYPEVFAGGGIIAGIPYKCANNAGEALSQCGVSLSGQRSPMKNLTPAQWGSQVRNASGHNGPYPRVSIWQGTADNTVNPEDQIELVDQWTNVLGIDQTPDTEGTINGQTHRLYRDASGNALVETVLIQGMGHGTPVDPGTGDIECGRAAPYILDVGICSSYHILKFWGLDVPQ